MDQFPLPRGEGGAHAPGGGGIPVLASYDDDLAIPLIRPSGTFSPGRRRALRQRPGIDRQMIIIPHRDQTGLRGTSDEQDEPLALLALDWPCTTSIRRRTSGGLEPSMCSPFSEV